MNSQFKKGVMELCILKVISRKQMSSFEILESISNDLNVNENTVYPILRRLTSDDYLSIEKRESVVGAPRKYYSITIEGKTYLNTLETDWNGFVNVVSNILGGSK